MGKNALLICGNGFDLYHGLKTSYSDFRNYCKHNEPEFYKDLSDIISEKNNSNYIDKLWSDLEQSIGNISFKTVNKILRDYVKCNYIQSVNSDLSKEEIIHKVTDGYLRILFDIEDRLKKYLTKEIKYTSNNKKDKISDILTNVTNVITFNYTYTLEKIYNFDKQNILHIHGDLNSKEIIIGHGNKELRNKNIQLKKDGLYPDQDIQIYKRILGQMYKNTEEIFANNMGYFNKLDKIERIIVFGHSLNTVDEYYFTKIQDMFPEARWEFSVYNKNDNPISMFTDRLGITSYKTFLI